MALFIDIIKAQILGWRLGYNASNTNKATQQLGILLGNNYLKCYLVAH